MSHRFLSKQLERTSYVKDDTKFTDPLQAKITTTLGIKILYFSKIIRGPSFLE